MAVITVAVGIGEAAIGNGSVFFQEDGVVNCPGLFTRIGPVHRVWINLAWVAYIASVGNHVGGESQEEKSC